MSPAVVRGVCPSASEPARLLKPGCKQLAFPLEVMPVTQLLLPHWAGVPARAVAVAALPVVLLEIDVGRSAGARVRKVGVAAAPEPGPAKTVLAVWVRSWGASAPLEVTGEPETAELKMTPSPVIPTLVTDPVELFETNRVRTSVTEEIAVLVVATVATGMLPAAKPVVFDAGAQLFEGLRYT
jgi:hypothetical protein